VNNKFLVFAQPIEGGDNVGEKPYPAITGKRLYSLFTVWISSS
jgi:hypothetical protein